MNSITKQFKKKKVFTAIMLASSVLLSACGDPSEAKKAPLSQYTQQGNTYLAQHQFKAAITAAKNAVAVYPEQIDGYLVLAKIYLQLDEPGSASQVLKKYNHEKTAEYYFLLLESYQKNNKLISANKLLIAEADLFSQQPNRLKKQQANILLRENKIDQASVLFKELEQVEKYKADALLGQARIASLSSNSQDAIAILNHVIERDAKNREALIFKSYLLIKNDRLSEAEETLSLALSALPSSDIFTSERINILQTLTNVLTAQGRSSEALLYSRILADEFPEAASINQNYSEATQQYSNKKFEQAKQTLEKILAVAPHHKKSLTLYGVILYAQGDIKGAEKYLHGIVDPEKDSKELTHLYVMTQLKLDNASEVLTVLENTIATEESDEILTLYFLAALNQQQTEKAKFALERIEALFPDSEKSILLSANYYSRLNPAEHEKALDILKQGLDSIPNNSRLKTAYLKKLISLEKYEQAESFAQKLQTEKSSNIETQLLIAKYQLYKKQYQQAEKTFNGVLTQQENNLVALFGIAQSKQQAGDWDAAQSAYRNIILLHPQELKGYQGMVLSQIRRKEDIEKIEERLPANYDHAILMLVLADAQLQQRNVQLAKTHIDMAKKDLSSDFYPYLKELKQKINYQLAIRELNNKAYTEARKITLMTLQDAPEHAGLLLLLARIEIESDQLAEATKVLLQVETILPNNPIISIYKADIALADNNDEQALQILEDEWTTSFNDQVAQKLYNLLNQQDKTKAETFLSQWQEKSSTSNSAKLNKALSLQKQGNAKDALTLYEEVLTQRPNELTSLNNAAWLYFTLNDDRAEALAQRAYSLAPENAAVADTYGWILYKSGKTQEAKALIQKAHELAPDNDDITNHWLEVKGS